MGQPMTRDELARHLYIHAFDHAGSTQAHRDVWAQEWDSGLVSGDAVAYFSAQADKQLAEEANR
jgi:hypothetical protein